MKYKYTISESLTKPSIPYHHIMSRKERPPDSPPPQLPMNWMQVGESSFVSQIASNPGRSSLLQQSTQSASPVKLTQGQKARLHIAENVRFEISENIKICDSMHWTKDEH